MGPWKTVEDHAMVILRSQQAPQHQTHDFAIPNHVANVFEGPCLRRVEHRADDNRRIRQAPRLHDERCVGALAGARSAAEKNDLFRETQIITAELRFEILPNRFED